MLTLDDRRSYLDLKAAAQESPLDPVVLSVAADAAEDADEPEEAESLRKRADLLARFARNDRVIVAVDDDRLLCNWNGAACDLHAATCGTTHRARTAITMPTGTFVAAYAKLRGVEVETAWRCVDVAETICGMDSSHGEHRLFLMRDGSYAFAWGHVYGSNDEGEETLRVLSPHVVGGGIYAEGHRDGVRYAPTLRGAEKLWRDAAFALPAGEAQLRRWLLETLDGDMIHDNVTDHTLGDYLTAPSGWKLGVYAGGTVSIGPDVGEEIDPDERPIYLATCPGIGNVDMGYFRNGGADRTDDQGNYLTCAAEAIRSGCEEGDVTHLLEDLHGRLYGV